MTNPFRKKQEEETVPVSLVVQALGEFLGSVDARLADLERKVDDIHEAYASLNRPK